MIAPIPRKANNPSRDTGMLCALCDKYGGAAKSHTTSYYKRWTTTDQDHPEGCTASNNNKNCNAHASGDNLKSVMAQQLEFNKSIMKSVSKLSKKKRKKSKPILLRFI